MSEWAGDPALRSAYAECRRLHAAHGRTYFLATLLLPPATRPHVHALYAFARYADEIVDDLDSPESAGERGARLAAWGDRFLADLAGGGAGADPVCRAALHTARRFDLPAEWFADFLAAMRSDLTVTGYPAYADLVGYVHGSAVVVGWQMTRVLGSVTDAAYGYARDLAIGFQLANFVRDVGEDLRRGRVYLPQEDLDAFGVTRDDLAAGVVGARVRRLLAFEIARAREVLRAARPGIRLLAPAARPAIETALTLYGGILDAVEAADYQVLDRRVRVGTGRRLAVAVPAYARALAARR